ncbi:hypothetical protein GCM10022205_60310 [Spinactinospora alkalitolerans]
MEECTICDLNVTCVSVLRFADDRVRAHPDGHGIPDRAVPGPGRCPG